MDSKSNYHHLETCQFVIDNSGLILDHKSETNRWMGCLSHELKGKDYVELMGEINPSWKSILPTNLTDEEGSLFLPWENGNDEDDDSPVGYTMHRLGHDELLFVTLTPALAPQALLRNAFVGDIPMQPMVMQRMFLRLQNAESRLINYLHHFPGVFFNQRPDLSFSYLGTEDGVKDLLGVDANLLKKNGSLFLDCIDENDRREFLDNLDKLKDRPRTRTFTYRIKSHNERGFRYIMDVRTPFTTPSGMLICYEGVWLDITRQAIAEHRLSDSVWKEGLATITNGLVHDFSNLMGGIFSLSEMYSGMIAEDDPMSEGMGQIKKSTMQAQRLVRRIIDLHRDTDHQRSLQNVCFLIEDQLEIIRVLMPKQATINTEFAERSVPVYIDEVLFRQTLLNFALNARDAMSANGEFKIEVKIIREGESLMKECVGETLVAEKDGALLMFSDNGKGIKEDHWPNVFKPYFSTKPSNKGSGFGLYNARLFAEESDGKIDFFAKEGEGATFCLFLPLAEDRC